MRAMLLDLFGGSGVALTVYELGTPPARPGRQVWREAQMQKYDEHRARLQAQGNYCR